MTSVRPSATLYREGVELDALLAELDAQHPGQVRVVDVTYGRAGGVLGFFAQRRVGVRYALDALDLPAAPADRLVSSARADAATDSTPLDALLRATEDAEAAAAMIASGRPPAPTRPALPAPSEQVADEPDSERNVEFARMLLDMAVSKAAERRAAGPADEPAAATGAELPLAAPVQAWTPPPALPTPAPTPAAQPVSSHRSAAAPAPGTHLADAAPAYAPPAYAPPAYAPGFVPAEYRLTTPEYRVAAPAAVPAVPALPRRAVGAHRKVAEEESSRTEFTLRRQLIELGVPVPWIPERSADAYWTIEQLTGRVPVAAGPDLGPGGVFVVVGPLAEATETARTVCARLRIDAARILVAGAPDTAGARRINHPWQAGAAVADTRAARDEPLVVVVATDDTAAGDPWTADMVRALSPDRLWATVDATRKPADSRLLLADIGRAVDAVAVTGAARTASPASVWELDVPVALIDGRPASRGIWSVLLIDKLADLDR